MSTRELARNLLEEFAQTRGPLMREPAWAVMRAVALAMVAQISRGARSPNLRVLAATTLGVHTRAARSKRAASKKEWAIASALFADVVRLAVRQADEQTKREALVELLGRHERNEETDDFAHYLNWLPAASIFLALLDGPAPLQLQAARWILSKSRALAERVGYGKPTEHAPPALLRQGFERAAHRSFNEGGRGELSPKGTEGVFQSAQKKSDRPAATPSAACGGSSPGGGAGAELRSRPPP